LIGPSSFADQLSTTIWHILFSDSFRFVRISEGNMNDVQDNRGTVEAKAFGRGCESHQFFTDVSQLQYLKFSSKNDTRFGLSNHHSTFSVTGDLPAQLQIPPSHMPGE
jgi:hypothetical protein